MTDINEYAPTSGRFLDEDSKPHNIVPKTGGNISVTLADALDHALSATSVSCSAIYLKCADDSPAPVAVGMAADPTCIFQIGQPIGWISTSDLANVHIKGSGAKITGFYLA